MRVVTLTVGPALAIFLALVLVTSVAAQTPEVQIAQLSCDSDPEEVTLENTGDADVQLAGWKLLSDPAEDEFFDLTVLGGLQAGATIVIRSGPSASGVFQWSKEQIFRDNDATDYARLVDNSGTVVQEVACGTASASPTATPVADGIPNGGGAPPTADSLLSAMAMMATGASMAGAGLVTAAFPWLSRRRSGQLEKTTPPAQPAGDGRRRPGSRSVAGSRASLPLWLALIALAGAVAVLLVWPRQR